MTTQSKGPALAHEALPETTSTKPDPAKAVGDFKQAIYPEENDTKRLKLAAGYGNEQALHLVGNTASDDPFDLAKLRIPQDFLESDRRQKNF